MRQMIEADLERVLIWRNHIDVRRFMYTQHEISSEEHRQWFVGASRDQCKRLLVFELCGVPCGFVQFKRDALSMNADWGFYLAPAAAPGTGRLLGRAALSDAFGYWGLHKVCGEAMASNMRSIRFHLSLGFHQEGVRREQFYDGNSYHDVHCFGLLASEWQG